ncbi:MAG: hypothetical protein M3376_04620 [Actinomycetota bacterium]|nr:hypothetical protein [Actinomycetota bacterium]
MLSPGERIVLYAGLLLIVDLVFLPWHRVDIGGLDIDFDLTRSGVQDPNGGYGVAAVVLMLLMIAQIALARLLSVRLPSLPVPWSQVHLILGIFVAVLLVIKLIRETEFLGYGAYSGILAGILVAYGGYRIAQEPREPPEPYEPGDPASTRGIGV